MFFKCAMLRSIFIWCYLELLSCMDGYHGVIMTIVVTSRGNVDLCATITSNRHTLATTTPTTLIAGYDVTISASWKSCLQLHIHGASFQIDSKECSIASGKCNLVVVVAPPVCHILAKGNVMESHHVCDLAPPMFTNPASAACAIGVDRDVVCVAASIARWPTPISVKAIAAHKTHMPIGPGEGKGCGHLVAAGLLEGYHIPTSSMSPLVVMVINKNNCIHSIQETPALSKIPQVAQLLSIGVLEDLSYLDAVLELSDPAHACVLCGLDGLATLVNHLHEDVRASAAREPLGGQVVQ